MNLVLCCVLQDPPGVPLYVAVRTVTLNGVKLQRYRCRRGSNSLEGLHSHLVHAIPSNRCGIMPFQVSNENKTLYFFSKCLFIRFFQECYVQIDNIMLKEEQLSFSTTITPEMCYMQCVSGVPDRLRRPVERQDGVPSRGRRAWSSDQLCGRCDDPAHESPGGAALRQGAHLGAEFRCASAIPC